MFEIHGITIAAVQILDPATVTGAEYFNYFFTIIVVFGMFAFGVQTLVRIISRS